MKKILSLTFLLFFSLGMLAQQEASNWYFGENAGITFDAAAGTVTALTDGQLNTREGCSSISDADGNLLFYSDGTTVWNRNHVAMPNGNGLLGNASSTQSAIIVAKPQDPSIYYIFTVDTNFPQGQPDDGLNYSEVDMTLDGGLGDVTAKNIPLLDVCSEKISAVVKDCVTKDLWVIAFGDQTGTGTIFNTYHAFEVTAAGVNTTPVTSNFPISIEDRRGYLKFSPDGTKMASANMYGNNPQGPLPPDNGLLLYDFDVTTGIVSNQLELEINDTANQPYGIEFSPSNEFLYVHSYTRIGNGNGPANQLSALTQFEVTSPDIQSTEILLDGRQLYRGALQLGPDGKIYRALSSTYDVGQPYLGVINNPDGRGLNSNYQHNAVFLGGNNSSQGLPPFDQSLFNTKIDIIQNGISITNLDLCTNDTYTLMADDIPGAIYNWTQDGNPLPESDFDLVVSQPGTYEVVIDPNNGDCLIEGEAFVSYYTYPVANRPINLVTCDDDNDGFFEFDLTVQDAQVLNGQSNVTYEVKYFTSQVDADTNMNEITGPFTNTSNPQEIFVRTHNVSNPNCFDTISFFIEVFDTPTANPVEDEEGCDDDTDGDNSNGQSELDLDAIIPTVLDTQNPADFTVTFHASQPDADANAAPLASPFYNTVPFVQTIYVRIENNGNTNCYDTTSFDYIVNPIPASFDQTLIQCDEDGTMDGFTAYNLTESNSDVTGGATNVTTSFYLSLVDAEDATGAIDGTNFSNTMNPQIVYVRVEDNDTECYSVAELTLDVSTTNISDAVLTSCDDDGTEDGLYEFTMSDADTAVLNGVPNGVTLFYYETYDDALLEQNPIGPTFTNSVPYSQIIYARAENANACYGISEVELVVHRLPNIETTAEDIYCLNTFPETIQLDAGLNEGVPTDYTYLWSTGEMTHEIDINAPGTYTVTVTNINSCTKDRTITVLPSNTATFTDIEVTDASSNNTITVLVTGEGDYEFSLDDQNGPYQDSNFFENVSAGLHTVYVRDKNNCGIVDKIVSVIGFPKYLTPNNDGYHDTWQVYGLAAQFQPNTKILIYDRYGKLVKQLDPLGAGWDGSFNGKPLPSNDYWFAVTLQDGRVFKSHFALKR